MTGSASSMHSDGFGLPPPVRAVRLSSLWLRNQLLDRLFTCGMSMRPQITAFARLMLSPADGVFQLCASPANHRDVDTKHCSAANLSYPDPYKHRFTHHQ